MFKLQRSVLSNMFHLPLLGSVLRLLANNLMYLNIYLATDWQHFIVRHHQQQARITKSPNSDLRLLVEHLDITLESKLISLRIY